MNIHTSTPRRVPTLTVVARQARLAVGLIVALFALLAGPVHGDEAAELDARIRAAETRIDLMLERYTERHPDMVYARGVLADLRAARAKAAAGASVGAAPSTTVPHAAPQAPAPQRTPPISQVAALPPVTAPPRVPLPRAVAREQRAVSYARDFKQLCASKGVLACFDFDGPAPLSSKVGKIAGELAASSGGEVRARVYHGDETRGGGALRMDFLARDGADHGSFIFTVDTFGEGDRLILQWRQWFSPALITRFSPDGRQLMPAIGGGGAKQVNIGEIGDKRGCSFGEIVAGNVYWGGALSVYHGCGLWYRPMTPAPIGAADPSDYDLQPGGDVSCRYRYFGAQKDYLYPTVPANLLEVPGLGGVVNPERYHGCIGWVDGQWITFRIEVDIAFCRTSWGTGGIPADCLESKGRLRYWLKYADEDQPWLVMDAPLPLRWQAGHSERYGRFTFLPYNTGEVASGKKPQAFTMYDDIVVARNIDALPWPRD